MRTSQWLLGLATTSTIVAAVAVGCGGSTSSGNATDSGSATDVTTEHVEAAAPDTGPETAPPEDAPSEACAVDANLSTLMVPDASIGDSGATTSECLACIQSSCSSEVTACNADCTCKTDIVSFIGCVATGMAAQTCGLPLVTGGNGPATALLTCLAGPAFGGTGPGCLSQCGVTLPSTDGGGNEGGDAGDAASD